MITVTYSSPSLWHRKAFLWGFTFTCLMLGFWIANDAHGAVIDPTYRLDANLGVSPARLESTAFRLYITGWEGCTSRPVYHHASRYTRGETTVGIGHNVQWSMDLVGGYSPHRQYTPREITLLYDADYARAIGACRVQIARFDSLPQTARWVCLSLVWTCGPTGFSRWSSFQLALSHHMYSIAAVELEASRWAHQVSADRLTDHWQRLSSLR